MKITMLFNYKMKFQLLKGFLRFISFSVISLFFLISCDGGLSPNPVIQKSYITGTIYYKNGASAWPPKDSVFEVRVIAFKNYPPGNILTEIINKNAYFTMDTLRLFVDSNKYKIEVPEIPVTLKYIVAAIRYDSSILHWKAIGVYTKTGDVNSPAQLDFPTPKSFENININVDFQNLPPQPF
jgi:hypothetical protein